MHPIDRDRKDFAVDIEGDELFFRARGFRCLFRNRAGYGGGARGDCCSAFMRMVLFLLMIRC